MAPARAAGWVLKRRLRRSSGPAPPRLLEAAVFDHRFDEDTELSGPMTLRLRVATTGAEDPRLFAGIEKRSHGAPVPFEGSYGYGRDLVAQGRLRLALRELDPVLSTPHQPEHTFRTLQPVRDGEEVDVLIPLSSSATLFARKRFHA
ncbi:CocE/NonD family hydrolase C-terminal non-catalytic domain-containing protein [Streptomyces griseofuscus]|uniref:Xaa-Pro dipeptidyl-peptidase C-terminal domain-containing protein n=1 Tax=Streptomyces griseofuscus TaxID=146922 RepID=A0A7H1PQN4_9ACTN|nr:CocE/NonD family hydrolase C-terminal non-catalytic domain-containing protein [Streptomyces griseofuscus]QNT90364.1 hypothetical protein HEP81_00024 [Streptomyces griseofuscus]QNT98082.1 hypothetical protein HEP81_07854 [Streptomyces griseofuscus]